ncbi:alpha/beta fold hydrolase [Mucilaginibacter sp.]|jgi:pimeloyl-ACP methyl ester carboxylesterase|uniref:alpha/beta fold hydrolase n=1 Tax=Mucilaginibacter sp. TaxID=1882438 RepID=UPI0035618CAF
MEPSALTLSSNDPKVINACYAEHQLFDFYGLQAKDHYVFLPGQGIKVRVSEIGKGEPLIIVPGNTGDVFPLASLLAEFGDRRIIAINRPGGGLSEGMDHNSVDIRRFAVTTLETVLNYFDLKNIDIVAHSMGAHWSLWLAMDRPKLVRSLTLLGNPGNVMKGRPPLLLRLIGKPPLNKLFFKLLMPADKSNALRSLKFIGHSRQTLSELPEELSSCYYTFGLLPHYLISLTSLMENAAPKIDEEQLKYLKQPTLFILGTKDTFCSIETGKQIAAAIPDCRFKVIEGAGHLPWLESPANCGYLIKEFLAER